MQSVTSSNTAVLFLDLQDGVVSGSRTVSRHRLRRVAGALARLCVLHQLPSFLSSVEPGGEFFRTVVQPLDEPLRHRKFTSAFGDPALVADIKATGRTILVLAGVASEIVVLRTALDAIAAGYEVQVAVDACGGLSERTEAAAWSRASASGAAMTSVVTFGAELAGDFTTELGARTLEIVYDAAGR